MKVKSLKPHGNPFGSKYQKEVGDIYDHPTPQADIHFGYVTEYRSEVAETEAPRKQPGERRKESVVIGDK